ncbi:MAG: ABC transporter ATP-binding protein, partial [Clostridia bacterium]|nr:ABC transporter ATP-binding protein [Clostridia bacterium]
PVIDKRTNQPVMEKVQKIDENGFPMFMREPKTYDIAKMPTSEMRKIRGKEISMIFQEPMTSLNPVFTIGNQIDEVVLLHTPGANKESAKKRSIEMLNLVGIAAADEVYKKYPHELSGGMRQRVMIAMALACNPRLIIADEPTTALDVTIQAQILDLLKEIKEQINGSIMLITHDLGVIAGMADYVVVMYAGRIIEKGTVEDIFDRPLHPYTVGLQKSKPVVNQKVEWLYSIPGQVPNPIDMPNYCYFRDRCDKGNAVCDGDYPPLVQVSDTHFVACYNCKKTKGGKK